MKVRCISNTGEALRDFEYKVLEKNRLGRFGATGYTTYGGITIGAEYIVMGLITFESFQAYLIDDNGFISVAPCQLFEVLDNRIHSNWHFRLIDNNEDIYPYIQSIFGYPELCMDKEAYENLIIEMDEEYRKIYFRRKIELEKE
jgi:hypothetical protein